MMNPTSDLNLFASLFPISSPFCMPFRIMMGLASIWDVALSIAILIVTIIVISHIAIKIYSNAILNYGTKMTFKDIIKIYKDKQNCKLYACILLLLTATTPSLAAVPRRKGTWIGAQYASRISTSDTYNNGQGIIVRRLTNIKDKNEWKKVKCKTGLISHTTWKTNDEGITEFNELRCGTYYIKETKAPKGYELSNRIAKVEINDKGIFVDGNQVEESNDTITFENKKIEVPKTGDNSHIKLAAGVGLLALLGIIYEIIKHKKNHKE